MQFIRYGLILLLGLSLGQMTFASTGSAPLTASEKLKIHKEWLERRRTHLKSKLVPESYAASGHGNRTSNTDQYFRRIIKFKSHLEPDQSNDISFMPASHRDGGRDNRNYKYDLITSSHEMDVGYTEVPQKLVPEVSINTVQSTSVEEPPPPVSTSTEQPETTTSQSATTSEPTTTTPPEWSTPAVTMADLGPITTISPPTRPTVQRKKPASLWSEHNRRPLKVVQKKVSLANNSSNVSGSRAMWSTWGKWTGCSRTCGGGVRSQERTCRSGLPGADNATTSTECIGFYKRYRICNDQACPENESGFREQQCSQFNTQTFKTKKYTWEPYIKADAECELNCKPVRLNYFATLKKTVVDGTPCNKPPEYFRTNFKGRAVCVEGICKAVHSSGSILGAYINNGAVRCGHMVCRPVTGIFKQSNLSTGYHSVATIPTGASNISITELKNSFNFLVLKTVSGKYILNGDFKITPNGIYEAAGAIFDYKRIDTTQSSKKKVEGVTEWITAMGPTTEPIHLMILVQHHHNPGIKYEYLLPINTNQNTGSDEEDTTSAESDLRSLKPAEATTGAKIRRRKFSWKVVKFATCSKTCGGGIQAPIIKCVREGSTKISPPKKCINLNKPTVNENQLRCNTQPCPAYWITTDCKCGTEEETKTREVRCVQELSKDRVIQVHEGACVGDTLPDADQICDCPKAPNQQQEEPDMTPRPVPVSIIRHPTRLHHHNVTNPHRRPKKGGGAWLTSEWNQCSTECGSGIQYRSIFCDRSPPNTERCDQRLTPDTSQQCVSEKNCRMGGEWFIGQWGSCSGDCFNLTRSRLLFCIRDEIIVNDRDCQEDKPKEWEYCELSEMPECSPKWHKSEWTECTKSCNEGTQRRVVKCLEPNIKDKHMMESKSCLFADRPTAFRACNTHSCHETTERHVDLIQNDVTPDECTDEFPNCHLVVKARLCHKPYYQEHCCGTCSKVMQGQ